MPSNQTNTIEERAAAWTEKTFPGLENWKLGEPKKSKRLTYNKKEGHGEGLPDGVVVAIFTNQTNQPIAFYSEPSE